MKFAYIVSMVILLSATSGWAQKIVDKSEDVRSKQNHFSIGIGGGFGLGMESDDSDSGISAGFFIEPGYTMLIDPWSIAEFSIEVSSGKIDYEDDGDNVELSLNFMGLIQAGYGYSLGDKLFTIFKIGAGPAQADYEINATGGKVESKDSEIGLAVRVSAGLRMLASQNVDFTFGLRGTYMSFDFDLENNTDAESTLTLPEIFFAARIKI